MSEDERVVELDLDVESEAETSAARTSGLRGRLPSVDVFSVRTFVVALALAVGGLVVGGLVPIFGLVGRFLGLFLAAFVVGLVSTRRSYLEVSLAGTLAAGLGFLLSSLGTVFVPFVVDYGVEIAGVGAATGLLVSVVGHYFGRDLRAGLTAEL
jgi:hypothetical protein